MTDAGRARDGSPARRSLAQYVVELIARLGDGEPGSLRRMQRIVGSQRALVALEDDAVVVWFGPSGVLHVMPAAATAATTAIATAVTSSGEVDSDLDGEGSTTHRVVLAILDGEIEVTDAILDGDIDVRGSSEAVTALLMAIEILVDAATRVPGLRELADTYRAQHRPDRPNLPHARAGGAGRRTLWPPDLTDPLEDELLRSLGLDNDGPSFTMGGEVTT
jgi:hypothetical protein